MKSVFYVFIVLSFGISCKFNQKIMADNICISGEIQTEIGDGPISSTMELFIEGELISKIDSTHNGKFNYKISNIYFKKTGFLVVSNVNLIVDKMKLMPTGYFPCVTETDTIPISINSHDVKYNIIIEPCKFEVISYPSKHY